MQNLSYGLVIVCVCTILWGQAPQQFAEIGDFTLENGQVIPNCKIGYRIIGTLNETRSNIILYPTWFGGNSETIMMLVTYGKLIDTDRYCVIAMDAFGNGVSSSPSHWENPEKFPKFTIRDMVRAEHHVCTEVLKINHLYGLMGGSMGAMQVLEWVVTYPDFMDHAVAYVGTPKLTAYDLLLVNNLLYHMDLLHRYNVPEKDVIQSLRGIMSLCMNTPAYYNTQVTVENFPAFWQSLSENTTGMNSYDFASQLRAIETQDISKPYQGSMEIAVARIKTNLLFIVSKQDHIVNPEPATVLAKTIKAPLIILENDMGHLAVSYELPRVIKIVDHFWRTGQLLEKAQ